MLITQFLKKETSQVCQLLFFIKKIEAEDTQMVDEKLICEDSYPFLKIAKKYHMKYTESVRMIDFTSIICL